MLCASEGHAMLAPDKSCQPTAVHPADGPPQNKGEVPATVKPRIA
jgi:hypothetical protein